MGVCTEFHVRRARGETPGMAMAMGIRILYIERTDRITSGVALATARARARVRSSSGAN